MGFTIFLVTLLVHASYGQMPPTPTTPVIGFPSSPTPTFPQNTYNGPRRCMVGTRTTNEFGEVTLDTAFPALCPQGQNYCADFTYTTEVEGVKYNSVTAYCVEDPATATCPVFTEFASYFGNVGDCVASICRDSTQNQACNEDKFEGPGLSCEAQSTIDVQLFPGCSASRAAFGVAECVNGLVTGYPYENNGSCRNGWDQMVQCMAKLATECLASKCNSVLDDIQGIRSEYPAITFYTVGINTMADLDFVLNNLFNFTFSDMLLPVACFEDEVNLQQTIEQLQELLQEVDLEQMLVSFGVNLDFCPGFVSRMQNAVFNFVPDIIRAETSLEINRSFSRLVQELLGTFQQCDNVFGFLSQISNLLDGFNINFNQIISLINNFVDFPLPTVGPGPGPEPEPRCPRENGPGSFGAVNLRCDRFYDNESTCGRKRAWMCDYSSWRLNFLRNFRRHYSFELGNDLQTPECRNERNISCVRSEVCCYETPDGCHVCFCQNHDYLDFNYLERRWLVEAQVWEKFFNVYQNRLAESMENNNNNDSDTC